MLSLEHNDTLTNIMANNRFNALILQQEDLIDDQNDMGNPYYIARYCSVHHRSFTTLSDPYLRHDKKIRKV